jgi:DNA-directed RNA polymerase subunit beta
MEIKRFGRIREVIPLPPLTEIQVESYKKALQADVPPEKRENVGIQAAFKETFPIEEGDKGKGGLVLDFLEYRIGDPPFSQDECREKDLTYQAPLYARLQLIHKDTGLIKEDEVFLGHLPLMTEDGSFIINGADRVIVSQIHRSPGVYFTPDPARPGRYIASIIPLPKRGPWIDLEVEASGVVTMKVNKRKFPLVLLLRVLGYDQETLVRELSAYGDLVQGLLDEAVLAMRPEEAMVRLFTLLRPGDPPKKDKALAYLFGLLADPKRYDLGEAGRYKAEEKLGVGLSGRTLVRFEDGEFKDEVFLPTLRYLFALTAGVPGHEVDDIDHLGNRRIRTVGELMADQFRVGLARLARGVRERMVMGSPDTLTPAKLVNSRPLEAALREFFSRSQLSQFKDETNPLSSLRHKRRISALGPGGLTRERAGFDVRDVHRTHYGRICPVETPEGANIGLITSLAAYARVDALGFIRTPYRRVKNGVVTEEVVYMTASEEDRYTIAQANTPLEGDRIATDRVVARRRGEPVIVAPEEVEFMDVSPKQVFSRQHQPHPLPGARRRQPGPHGLQHADPGRAPHPGPGPSGHDGPGGARGAGLPGRPLRRGGRGGGQGGRHQDRRSLRGRPPGGVPFAPLCPLQPGHRLGPAAPGQGGPAGEEGGPPGGRPRLGRGLSGPGAERPGGHHAL